jgi:hypothetical protein
MKTVTDAIAAAVLILLFAGIIGWVLGELSVHVALTVLGWFDST